MDALVSFYVLCIVSPQQYCYFSKLLSSFPTVRTSACLLVIEIIFTMKIKYGSKIHIAVLSKGSVNTGFSEQGATVTLWQVLEMYQVDTSTLLLP